MRYWPIFISFLFLINPLFSLEPQDASVIHAASEPDYPPFCIVNSKGEADGFSVELFKEAAAVMGLKVEFKVDSWHIIKDELAQGKIDALPLVGRSPEREQVYDFSFPYHTLHGAVFVRKGEKGIHTLKDLYSRTVIVMKGDNSEEYLERENLAGNVVITETYSEAFKLLHSGKHDAVVVQRLLGLQLLETLQYKNIIALDVDLPGFAQDFSFAVREGDKRLLSLLNEGLSIIIANGSYARIHKKWFSPVMHLHLSPEEVLKIIFSIVLPLALIMLLIAILVLRSEISRKTRHLTQEIQERKQAELERERLITAIEQSAEIIIITELHGKIIYINPAFEKVTGYSKREALGQNAQILASDQHSEDFFTQIWSQINQGKVWKGNIINKKKDSTFFTGETTITPVLNSDGILINYLTVIKDITRELALEQQVQQSQKMESIGRLAGGVAHDFNNMLSVILGYSEMMMSDLDPSDRMYLDLQEIFKAGQRSAELTTQLLAFSRKQNVIPQAIDLNNSISQILKMVQRLIGENINLIWTPQDDIKKVFIDPSQLDQILINLCVNAKDAVDQNGTISISTVSEIIDEENKLNYNFIVKPGKYTVLKVTDNGMGMDEETMSHIFEPFYTTKSKAKGTGLGLSTIYGIVKQNGGYIHVISEPLQGSSFKIYLPVFEGENRQDSEDSSSEYPAGKGEFIILLEDEPAILKMTETMISGMGYEVYSSASPQEAINIFKERKEDVSLVITDIIMPLMNGKEFVDNIQNISAEVKVLYMSGYTSDIIGEQGLLDEDINFIKKPFTKSEMAIKIRSVLDN